MEIKKLQAELNALVGKINNTHNHPRPEIISYMKVVEEIGEVTQVLLKNQIESRKSEKKSRKEIREELGKEISDTVISLVSLANDFDIDLEKTLKEKLDVHKKRNFQEEMKKSHA